MLYKREQFRSKQAIPRRDERTDRERKEGGEDSRQPSAGHMPLREFCVNISGKGRSRRL